MRIEDRLELLYGKKKAIADKLQAKEALKQSLVPQEIKDQWQDIDLEFTIKNADLATSIAKLEDEIKAEVLSVGSSVKSTHLHAVFAKGRISWDTKALDGYATAHPEIEKFKTVGEPTVSIREVKGG